jgi:hypothetical protein
MAKVNFQCLLVLINKIKHLVNSVTLHHLNGFHSPRLQIRPFLFSLHLKYLISNNKKIKVLFMRTSLANTIIEAQPPV